MQEVAWGIHVFDSSVSQSVSQSVPKFVSLNFFKPQLVLKRCTKFRQTLLVFRTKYIVCRCAYFYGNSDFISFLKSSTLLNLEMCRTKFMYICRKFRSDDFLLCPFIELFYVFNANLAIQNV